MQQLSNGHVFMSYSRKDDAAMRRIVAFLRTKGIKVWVDNEKLTPGTPIWEEEIEKAIKGASAIVVVLSPDSKNSEWVRREISLADQYRRRVFPVLVRGDEETSITLRLINRQFVDIRKDEDAGLDSVSASLLLYLEEMDTQEQKAKKETERLAAQNTRNEKRLAKQQAEEERIAREKAGFESKAKEEAKRLLQAKPEREVKPFVDSIGQKSLIAPSESKLRSKILGLRRYLVHTASQIVSFLQFRKKIIFISLAVLISLSTVFFIGQQVSAAASANATATARAKANATATAKAKQTATAKANATATARAKQTAVAKANATAAARASQTAIARANAAAKANASATAYQATQNASSFFDTFSDNLADWDTGSSDDSYGVRSTYVFGGFYVWNVKKVKTSFISYGSYAGSPTVGNFYASVDAKYISGTSANLCYGMRFRESLGARYAFEVCDHNSLPQYRVRYFDGITWNTMQDFTYNAAILKSDWNDLAISASDNTFNFYINKVKLVTLTDSHQLTGKTSLFISASDDQPGEIWFDNFYLAEY